MIRLRFLFLLLFSQVTFGQNKVNQIDSLFSTLSKQDKFSGSILIAEKGIPIYSKSFGFSNENTKTKLNENSIFELASVSKQFTAMGIAILVQKRKINFSDPIVKYIPELSVYNNVTIRHLLNHTSGLPEYEKIMDSLFDKSKIATNMDIIALFQKYKPKVLFEPNTQWKYSNTGYAILASIIERVAGKSYGDFLKQEIFEPLKMSRTFVYTRRYKPQKVDNYAFGYIYSDSLKKFILPDSLRQTNFVIWLDGIVGDGCVNSTVNDLLKWDRSLYTTKLVSNNILEEIFEGAILKDDTNTNYGFGWGIKIDNVYGKIVSHSGGWPGYRTLIERHVDRDKTFIILQNHEPASNVIADLRKLLY